MLRVDAAGRTSLGALLLTGLLACGAGAAPPRALEPVPGTEAPALLDDGGVDSLRAAVRQSLGWLERRPPGTSFVAGARTVTAVDQARTLARMLELLADDPAPEILEARVLAEFDLWRSVGRDDGAVLVTGYHEPVIAAAETPGGEYRVPVLGVPARLPGRGGHARYPTRAEIERGGLGASARPLAWARDPVDVFFMEVEGSGTLRLADGREIRVGPAATNGRPYRSIGRLLIDEGRIDRDQMTMRALRDWLAANPRERARVLRHNESVVFFRRLPGEPVGSLGLPLTPRRSIATDPRVFPPGALAFLRTERPRLLPDGAVAWGPFSRFVLSQDAGGAIRGPGRVDVFWGRGPEADLAASEMKQLGELYFLLPRAPDAGRGR